MTLKQTQDVCHQISDVQPRKDHLLPTPALLGHSPASELK